MTGLAALGAAPTDWVRTFITLGLLVGAVGTLFRPYKSGWVMVVAYAWHAANPSVLVLVSLLDAAAQPPAAKAAGVIVLLVVHAPLIAALVLVFRPAGLAAFRPGDKAAVDFTTAPPGRPAPSPAPAPADQAGRSPLQIGTTGKIALLSVLLLLASLYAAIATPPEVQLPFVMILLALLAYVPATNFALRANIASRVLRYFYAFTAVPLFVVAFFWMMHRLFIVFPMLAETLPQALASGRRSGGIGHALVVVIPTAILFLGWYGMNRALDRGVGRLAPGAGTAAAAGFTLACLAGAAWVAHDAGLVGSPEWRVARRSYDGNMPRQDWMTAAQFDLEFLKWKQSWFYPQRVEGLCHNSVEWYRVDWKVVPHGRFHYYYYYRQAKDAFDGHDRRLRADGYVQGMATQFRDCEGVDRYQATWVKTFKGR